MINNDIIFSTLNSFFNKDYMNFELFKNNNEYIYAIDIPGIKKDEISIEVYKMSEDTKILNVQCKRNENNQYELKSLRSKKYGSMYKKIPLQNDADHSKLRSNIENGVLYIIIPLYEIEISSFPVS